MADDDIREGTPKKKKAPPPKEDDDDRPRKKRREEEDEGEEAPRKKKVRRDEDEEDGHDLGSSALSAIIPVGGSIFALASLWLSVLSLLMAIASFSMFVRELPSVLLPGLWPVSLLCGGLSFFTHKHKASYGSIAGNMRAIIGILISLVVMLMHGFLVFLFVTKR